LQKEPTESIPNAHGLAVLEGVHGVTPVAFGHTATVKSQGLHRVSGQRKHKERDYQARFFHLFVPGCNSLENEIISLSRVAREAYPTILPEIAFYWYSSVFRGENF